jgi:hypothetical protein
MFAPHKQKLHEAMQKQNLSFQRATFGMWKLVVEYLSKQTRELLNTEDEGTVRAACGSMFCDSSLTLPTAFSRKELADIFSKTNKWRNDWTGHSGVVGPEEAKLRNELLTTELERLRATLGELWGQCQLVRALLCVPRAKVFENEVAVLMGSNSEFLKERRSMAMFLNVERIYLAVKAAPHALELLPLIQIGPSPQSAKNACYFFNRIEGTNARFVSYHYAEAPELKGQFDDVVEVIRVLGEQ